jgi:hypothetical protein
MDVKNTLNADGSGVRETELRVEADDKDEEEIMSLSDYRALMNVTEERGWSHDKTIIKKKDSGKTKVQHRFRRVERGENVEQLAAMSGDIYIVGTTTNDRFKDVHFTNTIYVETGRSPNGRIIYYRETFSWFGLLESLLDYRLDGLRPDLERQYPMLDAVEWSEWFGFLRGAFFAAVDDGLFDIAADKRAHRFNRSIKRVVANGMEMIRTKDPDAKDPAIVKVVMSIFVEWEEFDKTAEDMDLMGAVLALGLDLTVRVDVPGTVVETNADRREAHSDPTDTRQTLVWKIDTGAAVSRPVEIYVKSEVPGR